MVSFSVRFEFDVSNAICLSNFGKLLVSWSISSYAVLTSSRYCDTAAIVLQQPAPSTPIANLFHPQTRHLYQLFEMRTRRKRVDSYKWIFTD